MTTDRFREYVTMGEAYHMLDNLLPEYRNNNCIADAAARLRADLSIAEGVGYERDDHAPSYVLQRFNQLLDWIIYVIIAEVDRKMRKAQ